ncbi:MAG: serpin family protein [Lachnospiraceae bacterium]|nr:serpin family protein [Lachnospiraceae bacterium]
MKKKGVQLLAGIMACALLVGSMPAGTAEAANVPKLKSKKLTITKGKSKTIKVKGKRIKSKKFKTSKKSIATVSKKGKVKAKKVGTCKIKITVKYRKTKKAKKLSTKKLTCKVKVVEQEMFRPSSLAISDNFAKQAADTSVKLTRINAEKPVQDKGNVLISPESVLTAMAMVINGAGGDTLTELQKALYGDINVADFNKNMSAYNDYLVLSKDVQFHMANSIWIKDKKEEVTIKKSFLDTNEKYYHSQAYTEPFNADTVGKINKWVKENTKNMIPSIISNIPEDTRMYLINALAFEGRWNTQYSSYQVQKDTFTDANGTKQTVNMLNSTEYSYLKDEKATGVMKNYEGGTYAFVGILPNEGVSVSDYLKVMTGESFVKLLGSEEHQRVLTKIPEFSYDYTTNMVETMKAMGIEKAFTNGADFSNMGTTKEGILKIDDILHKTHIELDRYGTKAAAVTSISMKAGSAAPSEDKPKEVYLNRPFIYAIVETSKNLPIFMGVVNSVK